jgi:hypothetical protein
LSMKSMASATGIPETNRRPRKFDGLFIGGS